MALIFGSLVVQLYYVITKHLTTSQTSTSLNAYTCVHYKVIQCVTDVQLLKITSTVKLMTCTALAVLFSWFLLLHTKVMAFNKIALLCFKM